MINNTLYDSSHISLQVEACYAMILCEGDVQQSKTALRLPDLLDRAHKTSFSPALCSYLRCLERRASSTPSTSCDTPVIFPVIFCLKVSSAILHTMKESARVPVRKLSLLILAGKGNA